MKSTFFFFFILLSIFLGQVVMADKISFNDIDEREDALIKLFLEPAPVDPSHACKVLNIPKVALIYNLSTIADCVSSTFFDLRVEAPDSLLDEINQKKELYNEIFLVKAISKRPHKNPQVFKENILKLAEKIKSFKNNQRYQKIQVIRKALEEMANTIKVEGQKDE